MNNAATIVITGNSTSLFEDDYDDLLTENPVIGIAIAIVLSVLCLLTVFGNAVVLHAIRTERRLQTVSNMFIMSLAVADITVGLVVMPISSAYVLTGRWKFGLVVCQFWLSADYSASTASIFNLLVLSLDRYWSISRPLEYLRRRSKKKALIVITIVWIVSFCWIFPIIFWHVAFNEGIRKQSPDVCETEFADSVVFKITTSLINFYVPMIAMIVIYARIYTKIRKRARSEVMNRCSGDPRPDSFSGSSEATPIRYALATHNPIRPKRQKKKKGENATETTQPPVVFGPLEVPAAGSSSCEGSCDGSVTPAPDARWRCNVCGATQSQTEDWSWPQQQLDITKVEYRTNLEDGYSRNKADRKCKSKKFQVSIRDNNIEKDISSRIGNDIHLQVPQHELQAPSRSSSLRVLCGATRGVLRRPSNRRSVISLRQETKAARQLGVILGAFVACWLTYMILFVVMAACDSCIPVWVHTIAIWCGYFNSTVNPIIYALCNASFKRAFWKIGAGVSSGWTRRCRGRVNEPGSEVNPFA